MDVNEQKAFLEEENDPWTQGLKELHLARDSTTGLWKVSQGFSRGRYGAADSCDGTT